MPLLIPIDLTDTYDVARQKINLSLTQVNSIINSTVVTTLISLINPVNQDDSLFYSTVSGTFKNYSFTSKIQDYLDTQNIKSVSDAERFYYSNLSGHY